ncbi:unnamed protein product [Spirodela intermedia]|uniref:BHLH domain-containing protein n=1 Tax=Spirodela intermedia TaxID=51605 RepID=A0A7I8KXU1_SPIIN|nr:unnamed protein product [Spirodela intermedia]
MTMVSDFPTPVGDDGALMSEKHIGRPERRSQRRVPKKVHKAEREKLKREHLNDLFLELGQALEPGRHNNGKASVLGDAARLLRDMLSQVESLRRENTSLATESQFVAMEKSELMDENLALEQEIRKLQEELKEKGRSKPAWRGGAEVAPPQPSTAAAVVGPVYVIPINQELAAYSTEAAAPPPPPGCAQGGPRVSAQISDCNLVWNHV